MLRTIALMLVLSPGLTADALWDKAVALTEAAKGWLAQKTQTVSQELDGKGVVVDQSVTTTVTRRDAQGKLLRQNVRVVKNGKDEKPDAVAKATEPPKGPTDPLEAAAQTYTKVQAPSVSTWNSRRAQVYDYVFAPPSGWGYKGRIWLDAETGVPVHRESSLEPRPPFVDVAAFVQNAEYDDRGFVATTRLDISFRGSFLGIQKNYHIVSEPLEYVYLYK